MARGELVTKALPLSIGRRFEIACYEGAPMSDRVGAMASGAPGHALWRCHSTPASTTSSTTVFSLSS